MIDVATLNAMMAIIRLQCAVNTYNKFIGMLLAAQ